MADIIGEIWNGRGRAGDRIECVRALALILVAACGSHSAAIDGSSGEDAAPGDDAPIDVPFVKGPVHVTVANAAAATCMPDVHVVFIDVDSTPTDVTIDANGAASADVFPGASVTVVCARTSGNYSVVHVQDVEPGDDIALDATAFFNGALTADQTAAGTFEISFPAASGATSYTIYYPCGSVVSSQRTNVQLPMKAGCVSSPMDLVVVANTNQYAEAANVTFTNNGSVTVTDTWHPFVQTTATYTSGDAFCSDPNSPDYPCDIRTARFVPDLAGRRPMTPLTVSGATGTLMTTGPGASSAVVQTTLGTNGPEYQTFTDVIGGTDTSYALDFATHELPWMCQKTAQCPQFSGADATLTIPVNGTGAYDLFEADVTFTRGQQIFVWRIFGPTAGNVTFPQLPASVSVVQPTSVDHQSSTHARICESDALAGWRISRQAPFESLATCLQSTDPTARRYPGTHNRLSAAQ
jgi:archaellum component FlaF (FlaF/FlaG flagellin family)